MFPEATMPTSRYIGRVGLSWGPSIQRRMLYRQLERPGIKWADDDAYLIVENDMRALTYENVASMLTGALATGPLDGPNVRYLGGVLRAPMQRALRAQWRDGWDRRGGLPLEGSLNRQWANNIGTSHASPAFPFWLSAILTGCDTPNDLGREVARWRKRTKQLRQRRTAIENKLLDGDLNAAAPYEQAITGMVEELPEAKVVAGVTQAAIATATSSLALTGMPPFLADAGGALLASEVSALLSPKTSWLLRVTRPRL